jgi:DDE family transposase
MSRWTPTTNKTKNWSDYNRALKQRGSLSIWFDAEMAWEAKPSGHGGRQQAYSDAVIQACLTIKVLFGLPLRQTTGFVESLLELVGLDWSVPDFSTLCRPLPGVVCLHTREGAKDLAGCHPLSRLSRAVALAGG